MVKTNISIRIEKNLIEEIDKIASNTQRNRTYIFKEALQNYIDLHKWQLQKIERGLEQVKNNEIVSFEEVNRFINNLKK